VDVRCDVFEWFATIDSSRSFFLRAVASYPSHQGAVPIPDATWYHSRALYPTAGALVQLSRWSPSVSDWRMISSRPLFTTCCCYVALRGGWISPLGSCELESPDTL